MIVSIATAMLVTWQPLGDPIFVRADRERCTFQIQDMLMSRPADVRNWYEDMSDKAQQIDVVWSADADRRCIAKARAIVRRAGFKNVIVRNGEEAEYPNGLLPIANPA